MKLVVKYHQLAASKRTMNQIVRFYDKDGKYVYCQISTCKCQCERQIPSSAHYAVQFYTSNKGLPYCYVYTITPIPMNDANELKIEKVLSNADDLRHLPYHSDMGDDIRKWLTQKTLK